MNIGIYELSFIMLFGLIYLAIPTAALVLVILTYIKVRHIEEHLNELK